MPVNAVWLEIDRNHVAAGLEEAVQKLDGAGGEVILDFSSVLRIDSRALKALEVLAGAAEDKMGRIVLRGVNVDVYKVLKVMKLAPRFSFLS